MLTILNLDIYWKEVNSMAGFSLHAEERSFVCPWTAPFGYFQCSSLFLMWKLQQVLPHKDLFVLPFFSQHRIAPKLIKIVKYIYFQQIDTLTWIVAWLELNVGINQSWSFTVVSVIVSLYLWHEGSHCTYQVHCTSRMSQLLCDFCLHFSGFNIWGSF